MDGCAQLRSPAKEYGGAWMPTLTDVEAANRAGFIAINRRCGGTLDAMDGIVVVTGTHPSRLIVNQAFRADDAALGVAPSEAPVRVAEHFRRLGHDYVVSTTSDDRELDAAARDGGWRMWFELAVMAAVAPLDVPPTPDGFQVSWLDPVGDVDDVVSVLIAGEFAEDDEEAGMVREVF